MKRSITPFSYAMVMPLIMVSIKNIKYEGGNCLLRYSQLFLYFWVLVLTQFPISNSLTSSVQLKEIEQVVDGEVAFDRATITLIGRVGRSDWPTTNSTLPLNSQSQFTYMFQRYFLGLVDNQQFTALAIFPYPSLLS